MQNLMKGRTSFVIAHRLSTIREADNIVVMDHGRIVEQVTTNSSWKRRVLLQPLYEPIHGCFSGRSHVRGDQVCKKGADFFWRLLFVG